MLLKGKLEECKRSVGGEKFADTAAGVFESLELTRKQSSSSLLVQLNKIEDNLTSLTESVEDYLKRKKARLNSILDNIDINVKSSEVIACGTLTY